MSHTMQALELWNNACKIQVMAIQSNEQRRLVNVLAMSKEELGYLAPLFIIIQDYLKSIEYSDGPDKRRVNKANK